MTPARVKFGTLAWFDVVNEEMAEGLKRNPPADEFSVSFLERYHGGPGQSAGPLHGFRLCINGRNITFKVGVEPADTADVMIDADFEAVRVLASLLEGDPRYPAAIAEFTQSGKFKITGSPASLGDWTAGVHDRVTARTDHQSVHDERK
jgi:hypothetical protein